MKNSIWHRCYDSRWNRMLTKSSVTHPAKFSLALIERIFGYCLSQGYIQRGDVIGDPFGGVGTGGIIASYRGLKWVGVELEPNFCKIAEDNFRLHANRLRGLGCFQPTIIQGDSRHFHNIVRPVAVVSSPPFLSSAGKQSCTGIFANGYTYPDGRVDHGMKARTFLGKGGDRAKGNIETLPDGSVDACISSPPYADGCAHTGGQDSKQHHIQGGEVHHVDYGRSHGQIGKLKSGAVEAVVSSPPWEDKLQSEDPKYRAPGKKHGARHSDYGNSEGQIGKENGETYWSACAQVYASCYEAIKPGGLIVLVVKDYCKAGKRVPLCDDTARLIEHIGFIPMERIRAMMTRETRHADLFDGEIKTVKSRKGFFRRLAEKRGSPAIDFEEILIYHKP